MTNFGKVPVPPLIRYIRIPRQSAAVGGQEKQHEGTRKFTGTASSFEKLCVLWCVPARVEVAQK